MNAGGEADPRELRALVERIKRGECVLVLGPGAAIRPDGPAETPLDELLAAELLEDDGASRDAPAPSRPKLRQAAELYLARHQNDRIALELAVQDFYARVGDATTDFHRDLARLPFRLCICASADNLMLRAFEAASKKPRMGYYDFTATETARLSSPTVDEPLVYHLFGHHEASASKSLVLTEADLVGFLVAIVKSAPAVPDQVRSLLAATGASFLFLGFGFHNWYLRVLLKVMNVYGNKAFAFEDKQFFDSPEREQVVGFYSGNQSVEFHPLRREVFARQLRETYEASLPRASARPASAQVVAPPVTAPKAFISYASEDLELVNTLIERLQARGIQVWHDKQNLRTGDYWDAVLHNVIESQVNYVIVVQTIAMTTQVSGVFHEEIAAALQRQNRMGEFKGQQLRFLLPVRIGQCALLSKLKQMQVTDVSEPEGVDALANAIHEDWGHRAEMERTKVSG